MPRTKPPRRCVCMAHAQPQWLRPQRFCPLLASQPVVCNATLRPACTQRSEDCCSWGQLACNASAPGCPSDQFASCSCSRPSWLTVCTGADGQGLGADSPPEERKREVGSESKRVQAVGRRGGHGHTANHVSGGGLVRSAGEWSDTQREGQVRGGCTRQGAQDTGRVYGRPLRSALSKDLPRWLAAM